MPTFRILGVEGFFVDNSSGCTPLRLWCALVLTSVILINVLTAVFVYVSRDVRVGVTKLTYRFCRYVGLPDA